jgi:uncharacterized protein (TIGR03437 family)
MSRTDTARFRTVWVAGLLCASTSLVFAQAVPAGGDWRRIGSTSVDLGLSSAAGGPVDRVWFDGSGTLHVRIPDGRVFSTADMEKWDRRAVEPPQVMGNAMLRVVRGVTYRGGANVWRSEDGGSAWKNLTGLDGGSLLGGRVLDLAVDENSPERIAVASETGVWASVDGGRTWVGLNDGLPNLSVRRLLAAPRGSTGVRIAALTAGRLEAFEWHSGDGGTWLPAPSDSLAQEEALRLEVSEKIGVEASAASRLAGMIFAGSEGGVLWASQDGGSNWRQVEVAGGGTAERFWLSPANPRAALALVRFEKGVRVMRTLNGGVWWDDLTSNLPEIGVSGLTAHAATGAIYLATDNGVFWTPGDLRAPTPATAWQRLPAGWGESAVRDVRLDDAGHLLIAAVEGEGLFSMLAPHRLRQPVLVDAADLAERAVAPGSVLSLLGGRATSAGVQSQKGMVLAAQESESQIQLPYAISGERANVDIEIEVAGGRLFFSRALRLASPAIVVGGNGNPIVLDAESGLPLDAMNPARPGMRLQVLMSGLGRVTPDWPAGLAAPLNDAPKVTAPLRAYLDGTEAAIMRATLAPGYIGYYLVEVRLPESLPAGAFELTIEASGERSNGVRLIASE